MKLTWLLWALPAAILAAQPAITDLQPRGAQKGKPFTLTLVGRNLGQDPKIRSTMPASFTLLTPDSPAAMAPVSMANEGRYATFLVEPAAGLAVGVYPIRVVSADGISNVQLFTVGAFPEFTEDESRPGALPNSNDTTESAAFAARALHTERHAQRSGARRLPLYSEGRRTPSHRSGSAALRLGNRSASRGAGRQGQRDRAQRRRAAVRP